MGKDCGRSSVSGQEGRAGEVWLCEGRWGAEDEEVTGARMGVTQESKRRGWGQEPSTAQEGERPLPSTQGKDRSFGYHENTVGK